MGGEQRDVLGGYATKVKCSWRYRTLVKTVEEARQAARELIAQGVDTIKVYQHLTPEQLEAVVQEAHASMECFSEYSVAGKASCLSER